MQAGKLRSRVTIQATSGAEDDRGGTAAGWTALVTVWANVAPMSGNEAFAAFKQNPEVTSVVTIRYRTGVTPANRIVVGSRVLDITSVIDVEERRHWLQLGCKEYSQ